MILGLWGFAGTAHPSLTMAAEESLIPSTEGNGASMARRWRQTGALRKELLGRVRIERVRHSDTLMGHPGSDASALCKERGEVRGSIRLIEAIQLASSRRRLPLLIEEAKDAGCLHVIPKIPPIAEALTRVGGATFLDVLRQGEHALEHIGLRDIVGSYTQGWACHRAQRASWKFSRRTRA